jgi:hypothetical protein
VRLEYIRFAYPTLSATQLLAEVGERIPEPTNLDSDRLGSAVLELRSAGDISMTEKGSDAWQSPYYSRSRFGVQHAPTCLAHRSFPPLFACGAEAVAARGHVDSAIETLQSRSDVLEAAVTQFASVQEADRACLRIIRRMRLRDEDMGVSTSVHNSGEFQDVKLLWAIAALSNPKPEVPPSVETMSQLNTGWPGHPVIAHERYRTTPALHPDSLMSLVLRMEPLVDLTSFTPDASFEQLQLLLDCVELNECSHRLNERRPFPQFRLSQIKKTTLWQNSKTPSLERLLLLLRHAALDASKDTILQVDKNLVANVGYRRAARMALDEGELLALRLPHYAVRLLDQAYRWFYLSGDRVGAVISKICSALASARARNNAALSRAITRIQKDYTGVLSKTVDGLPKWSSLRGLADSLREGAFDKLKPHGWRPWLVRLVGCLAWQADGYRKGKRTERLTQWLEAHYGVDSGLGITLPVEFEGWLSNEFFAPAVSRAARTEMALSITRTRRTRGVRTLVPAMDVTLALQGREKQFQGSANVEGLHTYASAAKGLFTRLSISAPELLQAVTALAGQSIINLRLNQSVSWVCWEAMIGLGIQNLLGTKGESFHFRRGVEGAKTRRAADWRKVQHFLTLTNDLHVADFVKVAWGHTVQGFMSKCEVRGTDALRAKKSLTNSPAGVLHVVGAPTETSAGVRLDLSVERHWRQGMRGVVGGTLGSGSGIDEPYAKVGSTGGGYHGSGGGRGGTSDRGDLVRVETLLSLMPNMRMCILQATPLPHTIFERTQTDREQASYLRYMGADLFRLGVPVVVTIPPLPMRSAALVFEMILGSLLTFHGKAGEVPPDLEATFPELQLTEKRSGTAAAGFVFLKALADARAYLKGEVFKGEGEMSFTSHEAALEAALDLCLYVDDVKA